MIRRLICFICISQSLSVAALVFISASTAAAEVFLESDFSLRVPAAVLDDQLQRALRGFATSENLSWSDITLGTEIPAKVEKIDASVHFTIGDISPLSPGREWRFTASGTEVSIVAHNLSATQRIERIVNGVKIITYINAKCDSLQMQLDKDKSRIQGSLYSEPGNTVTATLTSFQWDFNPADWRITYGTCEGPRGLQDFVTERIREFLSDRAGLSQQIRKSAQQSLNELLTRENAEAGWLAQRTLPSPSEKIAILMKPERIVPLAQGAIQLNGIFNVRFKETDPRVESFTYRLTETPETASGESPYLFVPVEVAQGLIIGAVRSDLVHFDFPTDNFSAFKKLMASRVQQFILWTDLLHFARTTPFQWQLGIHRISNLQFLTGKSMASDDLRARIKGSLWARMFAPVASKFIPYMSFQSPLETDVQLTLKNAQIQTQVERVAGVQLQETWDPDYVRIYRPNRHFARRTFSSAANELNGQKYAFPVPVVTAAQGVSLQAQSLTRRGSTLEISLELLRRQR